jgi:hypothetical protein
MQPVVELSKTKPSFYAYAIRAPRSNGIVPPHSYTDAGFGSLSECLVDVARGLTPRFQRVYVRYQGICVGERDLVALRHNPVEVAGELVAEYKRRVAADSAVSAG